jgi:hypothetical protein
MTSIDPRLGEYASPEEFGKMIGRSRRTVTRMMARPNGLPYLPFGNETLIPIPLARDWMAAGIKRPNQRRPK